MNNTNQPKLKKLKKLKNIKTIHAREEGKTSGDTQLPALKLAATTAIDNLMQLVKTPNLPDDVKEYLKGELTRINQAMTKEDEHRINRPYEIEL